MAGDKFTAVWVSHSSIGDFLKCPRAYFLKNIYRNPDTGHKMQLVSPPLALGQAVHEVVESLSVLPTGTRFSESLMTKFDRAWEKVCGQKGGFRSAEVEQKYKNRGIAMLQKIINNPGPLKNLAVKIKEDLPYFWLSETDNIILCGKVDWLEYLPETDSVHIIDFKTGKIEEDGESLQLPIYHLLVDGSQKRKVSRASYWYLELHDEPIEKTLPDLEDAREKILSIAKQIKTARQLSRFKCPQGEMGCYACTPLERIAKGEGKFVGVNLFGQDIFVLPEAEMKEEGLSEIL